MDRDYQKYIGEFHDKLENEFRDYVKMFGDDIRTVSHYYYLGRNHANEINGHLNYLRNEQEKRWEERRKNEQKETIKRRSTGNS